MLWCATPGKFQEGSQQSFAICRNAPEILLIRLLQVSGSCSSEWCADEQDVELLVNRTTSVSLAPSSGGEEHKTCSHVKGKSILYL